MPPSLLALRGAAAPLLALAVLGVLSLDRPTLVQLVHVESAASGAPRPAPPPRWAQQHCSRTMEALRDARPAAQWPPACPLPEAQREPFERGGLPTSPQPWCLAERYEGARNVTWSAAYISRYCAAMAAGNVTGNYGPADTKALLDGLRGLATNYGLAVRHASVLVMGTENPWVECLLVNEGARLVTTFEYGAISVEHPRMRASLGQTVAVDFLAGSFEPVDLVVSYSSLEHSGLGRYGDALNPDGDRDAVAQVCVAAPPFEYVCEQMNLAHLSLLRALLFFAGLVHAATRRHLRARLADGVQRQGPARFQRAPHLWVRAAGVHFAKLCARGVLWPSLHRRGDPQCGRGVDVPADSCAAKAL